MSESDFNAKFFEQFLDDYFAEADEHLRSVRRNVIDLEDFLTNGQAVDKNTLNELFRSFHTLKGISAMAGVTAAESLAHHMESYLRLLRDGQATISADGLTALARSTQKLEEIVAARRNNAELPEMSDEARLLESLVFESENAESTPSFVDPSAAHVTPTSVIAQYLFTFVSAPELAERNINVNTVRERLQSIGTITKSSPTVKATGQVAFEFTVESAAAVEPFESWAADGISFQKIEAAVDIDEIADFAPAIARAALAPSSFVRVELSRLDALMLMVGELVVSRAKLEEQIKQTEKELPAGRMAGLEECHQTIERQLRNLRDGVMRTRMTPIGEVFERLQFAVRDLARESGKKIKLETSGDHTEIDKMLVEKVLDPLLHLVRNAVSHGIESAADRIAKNKPEYGNLRLHASTVGEAVVLEVSDDGAGIDLGAVETQARERGLLHAHTVLDQAGLLSILCAPGFTTRSEADKTSGRGVGMDVVRRAVDELNGTLSLETIRNVGSTFRIQLPLTLAIADALIVSVDRERFAVPQAGVREVIEIRQDAVRRLENNEIIEYRGAVLPLVRLSRLFSLKDGYRDVFHAFVIGEGNQSVGVAVDRVIGQTEIVIRAVSDPLAQVAGISGATELGDGRIVLILDASAIARRLNQKI
jgi:two-component system chemotaxis sensor kinase CheA